MTVYTKVSGVWKTNTPAPQKIPSVNVGGVWKDIDSVWAKVSGTWRLISKVAYSTGTRTGVNIYSDFGSPSEKGDYFWINSADIESGAGTFAVQTGTFPAGSTLTIINTGFMRGRGGDGGKGTSTPRDGLPGQTALLLGMDVTIVNASGNIWGGGGGGGGVNTICGHSACNYGGGGGAGDNPGVGGVGNGGTGAAGTQTTGGAGASSAGNGGAPGVAGQSSVNGAGGAAGKAVDKNGNNVTFISGSGSPNIKGAVS